MFNCTECKEPPYAERHVRWCERSENGSRKKTFVFLLLDFYYLCRRFLKSEINYGKLGREIKEYKGNSL